ncbi:L-erythro-3,5-diaminohexanoate dehydrogenase [Iocasia frigidifontis]|uniref:L-erythro-3,5-diaminohexanoate dehydrogenase n=1 Tax=Iocasia fonsfrigidae TaxID=2682810 RepID=A0A8A7KCC7_9FIRM|nr:L-erythro-3,5-diaminohexanoate dehydrogenase [Iocasia fonsfrigidae]QTL99101.1 L-erythro-3,5-diaminohexanoate dehydrogenase [Iocasia fonsfrigidae]
MKKGNRYGLHRVLEPEGVLPQTADKIDNDMEIYDNEILIDVQTLNIDSASFTQIKNEAGGDEEKIKEKMKEIVDTKGKHQNPVTGSGGMLIGTVSKIGDALTDCKLKVGDRIATLVSLSLTPLKIKEIKEIHMDIDQVDIEGQAVLFETGIYAKLPEDMEDTLALALLDVAGAPAQTARLVNSGDTVLIIGAGGKSGMLCLHEAQKRAGISGKVIALCYNEKECQTVKSLDLADYIVQADATKPVEVLAKIEEITDGNLCDLVINNVNVPNTEMASILAAKDRGTIYFFSMATSFTKAALGAEGIGKDVEMIIGNGYCHNHAIISLEILRENKKLREIYTRLYT